MNFNIKTILLQLVRRIWSDRTYYKIHYFIKYKKKLNLNEPKSFSEKLNWLKLYDRNPLYSTIVDKYAVREYVSEKIGSEYLIDTIGVFRYADEIEFKKFPNSFVLKATHGSGWVILCPDKKQLNIHSSMNKMNNWFKNNFYKLWGEWPYKDVEPGIICEAFLKDKNQTIPFDYKFYCFNGEPKFIHVDTDRFGNHTKTFYSIDWKKLPFMARGYTNTSDIPKPTCLHEMIRIAKTLSENIPFVRVDLYEVNDKVYFGELTLYPMNGLFEVVPNEYNRIIGNYLSL